MDTKTCSQCKETLPRSEFHRDNYKGRNAISSRCKRCASVYGRVRYGEARELFMWRNAKGRASRKQLPFDITPDDIIIPEVCPVLGVPFDLSGKRSQYSPSLDRIIPELGYVKGNIMVMCDKANAMKNCATDDELIKFANWVFRTKVETNK